jgi:PEP-CTERM motif
MRMRHLTMAAIVTAGALGFAGSASAAPVTFFGEDLNNTPNSTVSTHPNSDAAQASFLSSLTTSSVYNFDSLATGTTTVNGTFPGVNFTLTGGTVTSSAGGDDAGRFAISPNNFYDTATQNFSLVFNTAVSAFGFYGTDIGDLGGTLTVKLFNAANVETDMVINASTDAFRADGSALYFGFYDNGASYTKITFANSNVNDGFGFDNFTVGTLGQIKPPTTGTGVPEPLTLSLFGAGLAGAVVIGRRRKKA